MTYTKQNWVDGQAGATPISADRLNYIEEGLRVAAADATAAAALVPAPGTDLTTLVTNFVAPFNSSMPYREPNSTELANGIAGVQRLAISGADATGLLTPLGFTVSSGIDSVTKKPYIIAYNELGTNRGWGLYLVDLSAPVRLILEVPHPVSEQYTVQMGLQHWQAVAGSMLMIAGAHKDAASGLADVALHTGSMFHGVAASFASMKLPQIQYHGYDDATAPTLTHVVSAGTGIVGSAIKRVSQELISAGFSVGNAWDSSGSGSGLTATSNVQGLDAASKATTWIHVTTNLTTRSSTDARKLTATAVTAAETEILAFADGALAFGSGNPVAIGSANAAGTSAFPARLDHVHADNPATLTRITNAETNITSNTSSITTLNSTVSPLPRGRLGSTSSSGSNVNFNTTEVVITSVTVNLTVNRRIRARMVGVTNAATVGTNVFFKIKYKAGTTVNTTGTVVPGAQIAPNVSRAQANDNSSFVLEGEFLAPTTGSYVFAVTAKTNGGTANVAADASNHDWLLTVDDVGL